MVDPYRPGPGGVFHPEVPAEGPCRDQPGACRLVGHDWRERRTGPCFPLRVMRCQTHEYSFTLYPPGHVLWGRVAVVPLAPDGQPTAKDADRFAGTIFGPALDAARGEAWPRKSCFPGALVWPTMCRRLSTAVVWLGVAPGLTDREREERAADLDLDLLLLLEGAAAIRDAPGSSASPWSRSDPVDRSVPWPGNAVPGAAPHRSATLHEIATFPPPERVRSLPDHERRCSWGRTST